MPLVLPRRGRSGSSADLAWHLPVAAACRGVASARNYDPSKLSDIAIAYGIVMSFSAMSVAGPNSSA